MICSAFAMTPGKSTRSWNNILTRNGRLDGLCVGVRAEFAWTWMVVQKNGAPVWLVLAAWCNTNVVQWLADEKIKPPAVDSYVWHFGELGMVWV